MSHSFAPQSRKRESIRVLSFCSGPSPVQQHHKDECDIHQIVRRYTRTGVMPEGKGPGVYADVTHLQGDPTALREQAESVISTAATDLENHQNKIKSEQIQKQQQKQKQIQDKIKKQQEIDELTQRLAELQPPVAAPPP